LSIPSLVRRGVVVLPLLDGPEVMFNLSQNLPYLCAL
jgi:hypothetical protein